ncbi:helix-turn-helix domain-containing protein [Streptomyces sp. NPDC002209]|uniref:helix-turn-helix domain-containing protein n=1 Tax=Streptomyces sp. NPDC002209 TaxID=3364638 RepID=UPI0036BCB44F
MMNTGAHTPRGAAVDSQENERDVALAALRSRLDVGLARAGLTKSQLAIRAGRGRTTVQEAFRTEAGAPSAETVAALARVLRLPDEELLELLRIATGTAGTVSDADHGPGRSIRDWDPHDLEVHPAGTTLSTRDSDAGPVRVLPQYVSREHDRVLADAVREAIEGRSRMVVLVGTSSTGKTRACWEAVQPLSHQGWQLWHPFDPTRADAALSDVERVRPHTVVWLNEAQHYLGDRVGERIAAALHSLLTDPRRQPILILGTLWPEYADRYTAMPTPGKSDPHSRVRELFAGRTLTIPDTFDHEALHTAATLAKQGDPLLADTLTRTRTDGRVTQDLAGAPALLRRYEQATPSARALLDAAIDARRLGVGLHIPQMFLTDAASDYISDRDFDELGEDWAEAAYADLARPVHGKQAPLRRTTPRPLRRPPGNLNPSAPSAERAEAGPSFRLADYLEQHGRTSRAHICPPASFWHAALRYLMHPTDLNNLAAAAHNRHRLQWAHHLLQRAAEAGSTHALVDLAKSRDAAGDPKGAEILLERAADAGNTNALVILARRREVADDQQGSQILLQRAADAGNTNALVILMRMREAAGDREGAEALYQRATDNGHTKALVGLTRRREKVDDRSNAGALYQRADDNGHINTVVSLAKRRDRTGEREGAESPLRHTTDADDTNPLAILMQMREAAGDPQGAEALLRQAADAGNTNALVDLARRREKAGDQVGTEALLRQAADAGNTNALVDLARRREKAGDQEGTEALYEQAADAGNTNALVILMQMREAAGDQEGAEALYQRATDNGHTNALAILMQMREAAGDQEGGNSLLLRAADAGNTNALVKLARRRERTGDREGAETLLRRAADHGGAWRFPRGDPWPDGLDADGTPTDPWN